MDHGEPARRTVLTDMEKTLCEPVDVVAVSKWGESEGAGWIGVKEKETGRYAWFGSEEVGGSQELNAKLRTNSICSIDQLWFRAGDRAEWGGAELAGIGRAVKLDRAHRLGQGSWDQKGERDQGL